MMLSRTWVRIGVRLTYIGVSFSVSFVCFFLLLSGLVFMSVIGVGAHAAHRSSGGKA